MKKLRVYEYSGCSTCKKALKFLRDAKIPFEAVPIVDQPPTTAELRKMLSFYEGKIGKLFNTSGQVYREQGIGGKLKTLSEEKALALLAGNGKLVKRPFALGDKVGIVGFKEEEWKKLR